MIRNLTIVCIVVLASVLALCWYPLGIVSETHLGGTQILFYAFASAALLTLPFLVYQAKLWRPHVPALVAFALVSSLANTLFQYTILQGDPLIVIAIFCITLSVLMLFLKTTAILVTNFVIAVTVIVAAVMTIYLLSDGLKHHWTEWAAALIACLFFSIVYLNKHSSVIPLISKVSASFLGSTWLIGMITIFSERFSSYMEDNAVSFSVMYGSLCLLPILTAVLYVLSNPRSIYFVLWLPLLLLSSVLGIFLDKTLVYSAELNWPIGLLSFAVLLQLSVLFVKPKLTDKKLFSK